MQVLLRDESCRICDVAEGQRHGPFDDAVYDPSGFFVCGTRGSFLKYWALLFTQTHRLNFASLNRGDLSRAATLIEALSTSFENESGLRTVTFEHGPRIVQTSTGCGVDHAHVHVVATEVSMRESVKAFRPDILWRVFGNWSDSLIAAQQFENGYYMFSEDGEYHVTEAVPGLSQFFRQVLAQRLSIDSFDYRGAEYPTNVGTSIDAIRRALIGPLRQVAA